MKWEHQSTFWKIQVFPIKVIFVFACECCEIYQRFNWELQKSEAIGGFSHILDSVQIFKSMTKKKPYLKSNQKWTCSWKGCAFFSVFKLLLWCVTLKRLAPQRAPMTCAQKNSKSLTDIFHNFTAISSPLNAQKFRERNVYLFFIF